MMNLYLFFQERSGPKQMDFDGASGEGENQGYFFIAPLVKITQHHHSTRNGWQMWQILRRTQGLRLWSFPSRSTTHRWMQPVFWFPLFSQVQTLLAGEAREPEQQIGVSRQ